MLFQNIKKVIEKRIYDFLWSRKKYNLLDEFQKWRAICASVGDVGAWLYVWRANMGGACGELVWLVW